MAHAGFDSDAERAKCQIVKAYPRDVKYLLMDDTDYEKLPMNTIVSKIQREWMLRKADDEEAAKDASTPASGTKRKSTAVYAPSASVNALSQERLIEGSKAGRLTHEDKTLIANDPKQYQQYIAKCRTVDNKGVCLHCGELLDSKPADHKCAEKESFIREYKKKRVRDDQRSERGDNKRSDSGDSDPMRADTDKEKKAVKNLLASMRK